MLDLHELFQRKVVRPSTRSMLAQLPLLNMLLLLYFALSCLLLKLSDAVETHELCYGATLRFPYTFTTPSFTKAIYFTPDKGELSKTVIFDEGQPKHPRLRFHFSSLYLKDLREDDEGTFSILNGFNRYTDILKLIVRDCAQEVTKYYGDEYVFDVPREAEILEFASIYNKRTVEVVWIRSSSQTQRSRVKISWSTARIRDLTQVDNGYYNLRKKDNTLIWRRLLTIKAKFQELEGDVGSQLFIHYTPQTFSRTVTFKPKAGSESEVLIRGDRFVGESGRLQNSFRGRLKIRDDGLEISYLKNEDAGVYEFTDYNDNVVMTAEVKVLTPPSSIPTYIGACLMFIFLVIICCVCARKFCFKGTTQNKPSQIQTAPYHKTSYNQANTSANVQHPSQPVSRHTPHPPAAPSVVARPLVHTPVNVHAQTREPTVAATARRGPTPSVGVNLDVHSPDSEPRFEMKGSLALSAQPLNSDLTICDVYHSDKLNFASLSKDPGDSSML